MSRLRRLGLESQKLGVRSKESEVGRQNEEDLLSAVYFLPFRFVLTACIFFGDPAAAGPGIIFPRFPVTLSRVMESIKVGSTVRINAGREERGPFWHPRFFDRALRSVKEYYEQVGYIHLNPVRAGPVKRAEEWQWSSGHDYTGGLSASFGPNRTMAIDRVLLSADERGRI